MSRAWKKLLEKSIRNQDAKLLTDEFVSIDEAAQLLRVHVRTVQRRVRERSLLTLRSFSTKEIRIPAWTLGFRPRDTRALLAEVGHEHWHLYLFLREPIGGLSGLTPEQMLVPLDQLRRVPRAYREDLVERLGGRSEALVAMIVDVLRDQMQGTDGSGFG